MPRSVPSTSSYGTWMSVQGTKSGNKYPTAFGGAFAQPSYFDHNTTSGVGLNAQRFFQIQCPKCRVEVVAEEITDRSGAKVPEIAPGNRVIRRAVRPL